jgi:hypothetical protein
LEIDEDAKKADLRYQASSLDMLNTIYHVKAIEQSTKSDYTVRSEYQTASGKTNVEVKKTSNLVVILIAIVIGIVILLMFSN